MGEYLGLDDPQTDRSYVEECRVGHTRRVVTWADVIVLLHALRSTSGRATRRYPAELSFDVGHQTRPRGRLFMRTIVPVTAVLIAVGASGAQDAIKKEMSQLEGE